jgi:hypothetical protein
VYEKTRFNTGLFTCNAGAGDEMNMPYSDGTALEVPGMAALVLLLALATVAGAAAASVAAAAAPCPAQPCPGHAGRTYCPSVSTPHQCDQPSHPPCPPCKGPPIPPPPTPPIPPPPPKPTQQPQRPHNDEPVT